MRARAVFTHATSTLYQGDCLAWLKQQRPNRLHACVTDPPYGLVEYTPKEQTKLWGGRGGVWRIPPSFDGHTRAPLPRFTTLTKKDPTTLLTRFFRTGRARSIRYWSLVHMSSSLRIHLCRIASPMP